MNNFVFHEEYIIDIPEEKLSMFEDFIIQYGLYGKLPELDGFELVFWKTIQRRIDMDKSNYDIACLKQKINAINTRIRNNKATENDLQNLKTYQDKLNELSSLKRNSSFKTKLNELNEKNSLKLTHYDNEFKYDSDIESDIDIDTDTDVASAPDTTTPSTAQYSKIVFTLFKDAGLPCARNNEISFLQTDFKNALAYLHNTNEYKHIHSDDVIGAVKNYIAVYQDESTYVTTKMNFFSLVKSKFFYNLLPSNFDIQNFKKFEQKGKEEKKEKKEFIDFEYIYLKKPCTKCGKEMVFWNPNNEKYICNNCFEFYDRSFAE